MRQLPDHDGSVIGDGSEETLLVAFTVTRRRPLDPGHVVRVAFKRETGSTIIGSIDEDCVIIAAGCKDIVVEPVHIIDLLGVGLETQLLRRL